MRKVLNHWPEFYDKDSGEKFKLNHSDFMELELVLPVKGKGQGKKRGKGNRRKITCQIRFSNHCFTKKRGKNDGAYQIYYPDPNNERRPFCRDRHSLAKKHLRDLVRKNFSNANSKCFPDLKRQAMFFLIKGVDLNGKPVSYEVYFQIHKSKALKDTLSVQIDSAFIRDSRSQKRLTRKKFSIGVLASNALAR